MVRADRDGLVLCGAKFATQPPDLALDDDVLGRVRRLQDADVEAGQRREEMGDGGALERAPLEADRGAVDDKSRIS